MVQMNLVLIFLLLVFTAIFGITFIKFLLEDDDENEK